MKRQSSLLLQCLETRSLADAPSGLHAPFKLLFWASGNRTTSPSGLILQLSYTASLVDLCSWFRRVPGRASLPKCLDRGAYPAGGGEPAEDPENDGEPGEGLGEEADGDQQGDGLAALGQAAEVVE